MWCYVGLSAPLLGASGALRTSLDGETFGLPLSPAQAREMELTFDSTHWLNPKPLAGSAAAKKRGAGNRPGETGGPATAARLSQQALARARKHAQTYGDWPPELVRRRELVVFFTA